MGQRRKREAALASDSNPKVKEFKTDFQVTRELRVRGPEVNLRMMSIVSFLPFWAYRFCRPLQERSLHLFSHQS